MNRLPWLLLFIALALGVRAIVLRFDALTGASPPATERHPVPVEVGRVERGTITLRRTFSGTLEATAEFVAAPKVSGRLARLEVDLGDTVRRGDVLAWLDDAEYEQAVNQAEAELAVAQAELSASRSVLEIAERALGRAGTLREEGVTSESQMDTARAEELAARAQVQVRVAGVSRTVAALEAARIRLGYTRVTADWHGGDDERVVSERFVDEGAMISANASIMSVVELDPIVAVVFVPERDYARLAVDQLASLTLDTYPDLVFEARVERIAPVFRRATRQARVELQVDNEEERLKPGMFVRATIELGRVEDASSVPFAALSERDGQFGVFLLDGAGEHVHWRAVQPGIREGSRVELIGADFQGRVVTLGQELCDDGARIHVPPERSEAEPVRASR